MFDTLFTYVTLFTFFTHVTFATLITLVTLVIFVTLVMFVMFVMFVTLVWQRIKVTNLKEAEDLCWLKLKRLTASAWGSSTPAL